MAKKRNFAEGGDILTSKGAKKAGTEAAKASRTTSFGKFLDRKIDEADRLSARMRVLREQGPEALGRSDEMGSKLEETGKAEREKYMDSMGSYKKGGKVKSASSRADGIAQRGKTRGKMY